MVLLVLALAGLLFGGRVRGRGEGGEGRWVIFLDGNLNNNLELVGEKNDFAGITVKDMPA